MSTVAVLSLSKLIGGVILGYLLLVLLLAGCQRSMIYYPAHGTEEGLTKKAAAYGLEPWRNAAGDIIGWKTPADSESGNAPSAIIFHGNAGNALHRTYFVSCFTEQEYWSPWNVYIFEYPGYGARDGRPSEKKIKTAAEEAAASLIEEGGVASPVYLVGESLGTGVACYLAGKHSDAVAGLLLITPYTSLVDVGKHHYGWLPVGLLLRDRFDNREALTEYSGPIAFVVAADDRVIPAEIGRQIFEAYDGPKRLWQIGGRGHNTLDYHPDATWWREVLQFLRK